MSYLIKSITYFLVGFLSLSALSVDLEWPYERCLPNLHPTSPARTVCILYGHLNGKYKTFLVVQTEAKSYEYELDLDEVHDYPVSVERKIRSGEKVSLIRFEYHYEKATSPDDGEYWVTKIIGKTPDDIKLEAVKEYLD